MPRIQVYTDPETKRRIELAAARLDVAVTQYCLEAIRQRLADEEMLEKEKIEIPVKPQKDETLIADLRALREPDSCRPRRSGLPGLFAPSDSSFPSPRSLSSCLEAGPRTEPAAGL